MERPGGEGIHALASTTKPKAEAIKGSGIQAKRNYIYAGPDAHVCVRISVYAYAYMYTCMYTYILCNRCAERESQRQRKRKPFQAFSVGEWLE